MSKIEINEYVRTKNGIIDKVERFSVGCCVWHCENGMCIDECNCIGIHLEDIVNHSKQLIDLIEVGDFVNGHRVVNEMWGEDDNDLYFEIEGGFNKAQYIGEKDIKTILTKEQYMTNCYKVGGRE